MIASAAAVALAVAITAALMRLNGSTWNEVGELVAILAPIALAWLAAVHVVTARTISGSIRRHYAAGSIAAVALVLVSTVFGTELMVVSRHDARMVSALLAFSLIVALRIASLLSSQAARQLTRLGDRLDRLAGDRGGPPIAESGPRELAAVAAAANRMARDLDASDRARRELVAAVSHDLRTPIASLSLIVDAIGDGVVTDADEIAEYHARMRTHLAHLRQLVNDLFELARLDAGDVSWLRTPVAVAELVEESAEAFRPRAEERSLTIHEELEPGLPTIDASAERLQRVLFNLLANAVGHTPPGGSVTVRAARAGDAVRFEVADSGTGIAASEAARVFDRFYRGGEESARPAGGAGLGLAIARSIVEAHGGQIWVENPGEAGARLAFTVPVHCSS